MFKKCPQYVLYRTIMSIFGSMIGIFDIYMIRFAINALHSGANFEQAIGYLVALIISYVLYSLIYGFVSVRAKPHFECVLKKGIKKDIYNMV